MTCYYLFIKRFADRSILYKFNSRIGVVTFMPGGFVENIIDMHVHFGAPDDPDSGCYWSSEFEKTAAYLAILMITGSLFRKMDINRVRNHLLEKIHTSEYIKQAVFLAMDEVYDAWGKRHKEWTHLHVPNDFLASLVKNDERLLFACSIHPYRSDWEEQLDQALQEKTVMCKWIPSSQQIDPGHDKCLPLYRKLAKHRLPLLCHTGPEYAIPTSDKSYNQFNNPRHLRRALDEGVRVIMAHCALPYFWFLDADYQDDFNEFLMLVEQADRKGWELYADVSAIATPLRAPYIDRVLKNVPPQRILFGSDYPIPLSEFTYNRSRNFWSWLRFLYKTMFVKNPLDKNYLVIRQMGFDETIFTNASKLFDQIQY